MSARSMLLVAAFGALATLGACNPYLTAQSVAPPGRTARLDPIVGFWTVKAYRLELSQGVAFAMTCNYRGPCEHVAITTDDPAVAEVRRASLSSLERVNFSPDVKPASAVVIVGKAAGTTRVHIRSEEGYRDVMVTVLAPPPPAPALRPAG